MTDRALLELMRLLAWAGIRSVWKQVKTPAGAVLSLLILAAFGVGVVPTVVMSLYQRMTDSPMGAFFAAGLPTAFFVMAVIAIISDAGKQFLELRPPELQFVLGGPFTDAQILSYRLATVIAGWAPVSLMLACFMMPYTTTFLGASAGIFFGGLFIFLLAFFQTLIGPRLSPTVSRSIRWILLACAAATTFELALTLRNADTDDLIASATAAFQQGWSTRLFGMPFQPFANLIFRPLGMPMIGDLLLGIVLVGLTATACYRVNAGFSELAVEGVARRMKKLERLRSGNVYASRSESEHRKSFPAFPFWGGVGPVAWNQITTVWRRSRTLMIGIAILGLAGSIGLSIAIRQAPDFLSDSQQTGAVPLWLFGAAYVGMLVSLTSQLGFSTSPRLLSWYQTLPTRPLAISIGMLAGMMTLLLSIRLSLFLPAIAISNQSWPTCISFLFAGVVMDLALATAINLLTATSELRPMPQGTPDIFQGARAMAFMFGIGIALLPATLAASIGFGVTFAIVGQAWGVCALGAAISTLLVLPSMWWASGYYFTRREFGG